jgi:hypothetical protein
MPTSTLLRATFFALGAAVGGGAVVVLNASKKKEAVALPPLVEVGVIGDVGPVLKYGNPGTISPSMSHRHLLFDHSQVPSPTNSRARHTWLHMIVACDTQHGSVELFPVVAIFHTGNHVFLRLRNT